MKKALTRGEKWLSASPLLFLVIAGAAWQWRRAAPHSIELPAYNIVHSLSFSSDGKRLVVVSTNRTSETLGQIYNLESRSVSGILAMPQRLPPATTGADIWGEIVGPSWSSDGKRLVAGTYVGNSGKLFPKIVIWDAEQGKIQSEFFYGKPSESPDSESFNFSPDGTKLIGQGTPPAIYDAATGARLNKPDTRYPQQPFDSQLNEKLGLLALGNSDSPKMKVVDFKTKREVWVPKLNYVRNFSWSDDILGVNESNYSTFGSQSSLNRLWLWDGRNRKQLLSPPLIPRGEITDFSFNPDGRSLAYLAANMKNPDGELTVWDYRANRVLWRDSFSLGEYHIAELPPANIQPSPDGKMLAVTCNERLAVYDHSGKLQYERAPVGERIRWSSDSKQLAIGITEKSKSDLITSNRIEIHRFED